MIDLAVISGSGFYDLPELENSENVRIETEFGPSDLKTGTIKEKRIAFIARHGEGHVLLPHLINYRANMISLKELGTRAVVMTTVCGVLDKSIPLAKLVVFDDLYFPDNRLPEGEICSIFKQAGDKDRGHLIFGKPFSEELRQQILDKAGGALNQGVYAHANGPRFNSKTEIQMFQRYADFISQTAGPEVILAGELEIPCALVGYGVDYANGVTEEPTPVEVLGDNLRRSRKVFTDLIIRVLEDYKIPPFSGFVYRF